MQTASTWDVLSIYNIFEFIKSITQTCRPGKVFTFLNISWSIRSDNDIEFVFSSDQFQWWLVLFPNILIDGLIRRCYDILDASKMFRWTERPFRPLRKWLFCFLIGRVPFNKAKSTTIELFNSCYAKFTYSTTCGSESLYFDKDAAEVTEAVDTFRDCSNKLRAKLQHWP